MESFFVPLPVAAGGLLAVQAGADTQLAIRTGSPVAGTVLQLAVGAVALLMLAVFAGTLPAVALLPDAPWWHAVGGLAVLGDALAVVRGQGDGSGPRTLRGWLGGIAGAIYATTMFAAIPVIGTAAAVGPTVAGQQTASVFVDRYGLMRLPRRPVSILHLTGVAALLSGVALIQMFRRRPAFGTQTSGARNNSSTRAFECPNTEQRGA